MQEGPRPPGLWSSRVSLPVGFGVITAHFPRPRSRGPGRPFGPWPAGWAWAQPHQPPGITPRPRPPGAPEPPPGWQPPGWTSALTRVPVHSRVCDAHTGHKGAGSVPLKFCPNAMVASHLLVHFPWRSSQGLGWAGSSPLIPEIVGVTVTPSHPHALARQAHRDDPDRSNPEPGGPHGEPRPRGAAQEPRGPRGSHTLSSARGCRERPSVPWRPWSLTGPDGAAWLHYRDEEQRPGGAALPTLSPGISRWSSAHSRTLSSKSIIVGLASRSRQDVTFCRPGPLPLNRPHISDHCRPRQQAPRVQPVSGHS